MAWGQQPKVLARGGLIAGAQANTREVYVFHSDKVTFIKLGLINTIKV